MKKYLPAYVAGIATVLILCAIFSLASKTGGPAAAAMPANAPPLMAQGLMASVSGAYGQPTYVTPFQIQATSSGTSQVVALASGGTLGADAGSTVDLSRASLILPGGFSLGANYATVPAGDTLSSAVGSTVNLSSGTITLPTFSAGAFNGSNGTSASIALAGALAGQKVVAVWEITGGSGGGNFNVTAGTNFASSIVTSGSFAQTSSANLSTHYYNVLLMNQGP